MSHAMSHAMSHMLGRARIIIRQFGEQQTGKISSPGVITGLSPSWKLKPLNHQTPHTVGFKDYVERLEPLCQIGAHSRSDERLIKYLAAIKA